jgi:hypothetical protein
MRIAARDGHHHRKARKQFMRWIVALCLLGVTACGQIPGAGTGESTALGQTVSTRWQDQGGKLLSVPEVEQAYRACQNSMFSPLRASAATITPLEDESFGLALTNPEFDVCMHSFGYSQIDASTSAKPSGVN